MPAPRKAGPGAPLRDPPACSVRSPPPKPIPRTPLARFLPGKFGFDHARAFKRETIIYLGALWTIPLSMST